jgi:histidine decarboxylase
MSTQLEEEIITYIKNKYDCRDEVAGHFGSGSTEANIYATWMGKRFLQEKIHDQNLKKIILLKSSLAHYSLVKAASINEIKIEEIAIKKPEYIIDEEELALHLHKLYNQGIRGFLLPLTLGYTTFGTEDDYKKICALTKSFRKKHPDSFFFIWLDAAFNGVIKIYLEKNFQPFAQKEIQLITSDFHKTMGTPYPSNVILYRKNLLKLIEQPIPYIDQKDTTLLGSRPGNPIISTWMTMLLLGENSITKQLSLAIEKKNEFMKKLKEKDPTVELISGKNSFQMAVVLKKKSDPLYKNFQKNTIPILYQGKKEAVTIAKFYFFPKL